MKNNEKCLYVSFEEKKGPFYANMNEFGWNLYEYEEKGLFNLELNALQSVLLNKPFEPLDAVAILRVIVPLDVIGVEPIVTPLVLDESPTLVTVPTLHDLLALKSKAVPFIVSVRVVGTAPIVEGIRASHTGAAAFVPSPVDVKNILVVVILPALRSGAPTALP